MTAVTAPGVVSPRAWWRARSRPVRVALVALVALVGFNGVSWLAERALGGRSATGPASSSYATSPAGLAAFAELLGRYDHEVVRVRDDLADIGVPTGVTVVVAGVRLPDDDVDAVAAAVRRGSRLVALGPETTPLVRAATGLDVRWAESSTARLQAGSGAAEVGSVTTISGSGTGSWVGLEPAHVLFGSAGGPVGGAVDAGRGRVVFVADAAVLQNRFLARTDNAAFGLAAVGPRRPVLFAEAPHGYGRATGLAALPAGVRAALLLGAVATGLWMWSRGRRFGPVEARARTMAPPRRAYVDALATTLLRTGDRQGSIEPLVSDTRQRLARRAGLGADATDDDLRTAAVRLGIAPGDVEALLRPVTTDDHVLSAGHARARMEEKIR